MALLLDSNIFIDVLRNSQNAMTYFRSQAVADEELYASEVTKAEILAGARSGEEDDIEQLFRLFSWIKVDDTVARLGGAFANEFRNRHPNISMEDYLIAASSVSVEAEMVTLNIKDFPMFKGLKPPY